MKTIISLFISLILLTACSQKQTEVERLEMKPVVVYDSIESRMPGNLMINDRYAVWTDPFSSENLAHVIDLTTNKETGAFINMGNGPEEFITPAFSLSPENELVVYDMNNDKIAYYSLDKMANGSAPLVSMQNKKTKGFTRIMQVDNNSLIYFDPKAEYPFQTESGNSFGKYPVNEKIKNSYDVFQGNIAYNPHNGLFIYSTFSIPYIAAYQKKGTEFKLVWETAGEADYAISDDKMILNRKKENAKELALTKDYIVTLQRDYLNDPTDETTVGRDFTKLPQTLFLYDYKSNLKKIIHLQMPILRIAADSKSNTVYAITVNPDFMLVKCELPLP